MHYFSTMRAVTIAACTALLITSCGGGGSAVVGGAVSLSGIVKVVDGYIQGAIVFLDKNNNGVRDTGEPVAVNTNPAIGEYTFKGIAQATLDLYPVVVEVPVGATDSDRPGQPITKAFNMTSTTGSSVVSPMTTLIQSQLNNNPGTTPAQAQASIKKLIGLPANSTVDLTANYVGQTGANKAEYQKLHRVAQSVAASVAANQTILQNAAPQGTKQSTLVDLMVQNALASLPTIVMKVDVAGAKFDPASTGALIGASTSVINVAKLQQQLASQKKKLAKPVLTLAGPSVITLTAKAGATYTEQGAVLHSNDPASIAGVTVTSKVSGTGTVIDPTAPGSYTITYTATDKNNIAAAALTRKVNVIAVADKTLPVLQLIGGNQTFAAGTAAYLEQGAVALDAVVTGGPKADISSAIIISGLVQSGVPGTYIITYNVNDAAGNAAKQLTRTVTVTKHLDKTPATIVLKGAAVMTVVQGSAFTDPGADAVDLIDGTKPATVTGKVNTATVGKVTLTYSSTDTAKNVSIPVTRVVNVVKAKDTAAPVLTLKGGNVPAHKQGTPYIDAGATAFDAVDGNLTGTMIVKNPVDVTTPGTYTITYNVKDAAGNPATKTRTVTVKAAADTTPPVLTLKGKASITIVQGTAYKDAGATAFDLKDGDITAKIVGTNPVNTAKAATYTVTYNVNDAAGNPAAALLRTVRVTAKPAAIDNTLPVITLKGRAKLTLELGTAYKDAGATAFDTKDGVLTPVKKGIVNTAVVGIYTLKYNVADKAGNKAAQVIRTVSVVDTTLPVVTAPAALTIEATAVKTAVILGTAKATDAGTPVLTATAAPAGPYTVGAHTIIWSATDAAGNVGTATQRVTVKDTTPPVFQGLPLTSVTAQATAVATAVKLTAPTATDIFAVAVTSNAPATFPVGTTKVTWTATDANGVTSTALQNVVVQDTTPPVITLNNPNMTVLLNQVFTDPGAIAADAVDGNITITGTGIVNTKVLGIYTVVYKYTDAAGNIAIPVSRSVQVVKTPDTTAPVITLLGTSTVNLTVGGVYSDAGVTAMDNRDGNVTAFVATTNPVDTKVAATYTITYNVSDAAGNPAIQVIRTVIVAPLAGGALATNQINNGKLLAANTTYSNMLATNATDIEAVIGLSMTAMAKLIDNQALRTLMTQFTVDSGASLPTGARTATQLNSRTPATNPILVNWARSSSQLVNTAITANQLQDPALDPVIAELGNAITRLEALKTAGFTSQVVQGKTWDVADINGLLGVLYRQRGLIRWSRAYNWETKTNQSGVSDMLPVLDPTTGLKLYVPISADPVAALNDPSFFTLQNNGMVFLSGANADFLATATNDAAFYTAMLNSARRANRSHPFIGAQVKFPTKKRQQFGPLFDQFGNPVLDQFGNQQFGPIPTPPAPTVILTTAQLHQKILASQRTISALDTAGLGLKVAVTWPSAVRTTGTLKAHKLLTGTPLTRALLNSFDYRHPSTQAVVSLNVTLSRKYNKPTLSETASPTTSVGWMNFTQPAGSKIRMLPNGVLMFVVFANIDVVGATAVNTVFPVNDATIGGVLSAGIDLNTINNNPAPANAFPKPKSVITYP